VSEFGSIYSIEEAVSHPLSSVSSKGDWYEVMGEFELEAIPKLDAEQSLSAWERTFTRLGDPLAKFYTGDLSTVEDGYGDPRVVFLSSASVITIYQELVTKGKAYFEELLAENESANHIWLYEPMVVFFEETIKLNHGSLVLSGH